MLMNHNSCELQGESFSIPTMFPLSDVLEIQMQAGFAIDRVFPCRQREDEELLCQENMQTIAALAKQLNDEPLNDVGISGYWIRAVYGKTIERMLVQTLVGAPVCMRVRIQDPHGFMAAEGGVEYQNYTEGSVDFCQHTADFAFNL